MEGKIRVLVFLDKRTRYCSKKLAGGLFIRTEELGGLHVWKGKLLTIPEFNADMKMILGPATVGKLGEVPKIRIVQDVVPVTKPQPEIPDTAEPEAKEAAVTTVARSNGLPKVSSIAEALSQLGGDPDEEPPAENKKTKRGRKTRDQ